MYPRLDTDMAGSGVVSQAGGVALVETIRASGLDAALSAALAPWRKPTARHDPGKVITDLALTLALGGDCLADIGLLRAEPDVFGLVASDPTVSRTIDALAADAPRALRVIDTARAMARAAVWSAAGQHAPDHRASAEAPVVIDVDATLVTAHSEKEKAAPTFKRGYGFHPLWAFADHGSDGTGEPLSFLLRKGNAGSNTAADHIRLVRAALVQLPGHRPGTRPGRKVLIRTDGAGSSHEFLGWLSRQRLSYSVGFTLPTDFADTINTIPEHGWTPAYDADRAPRGGAWVAEVTGLMNLTSWPAGMRVIVRKERPHPGAQLRITDADGHRITAFATNTKCGQLAAGTEKAGGVCGGERNCRHAPRHRFGYEWLPAFLSSNVRYRCAHPLTVASQTSGAGKSVNLDEAHQPLSVSCRGPFLGWVDGSLTCPRFPDTVVRRAFPDTKRYL